MVVSDDELQRVFSGAHLLRCVEQEFEAYLKCGRLEQNLIDSSALPALAEAKSALSRYTKSSGIIRCICAICRR